MLEEPRLPERDTQRNVAAKWIGEALAADAHDGPAEVVDEAIVISWAASTHATAGVNCSTCHESGDSSGWSDAVALQKCSECHKHESEGFLSGRHGMRLAVGLEPMRPEQARLPMQKAAAHRELTCNACHPAHDYNTRVAAVDACLACHNDPHTLAYQDSPHFALWQAELEGGAPAGSGVSCATCHLPRIEHDDAVVRVEHNQNDNLRPNEKMVRTVCAACHGLQYTLDALVDRSLIESNFAAAPTRHVESVEMAHQWLNRRKTKSNRESPME
jgi:hypothetical protein